MSTGLKANSDGSAAIQVGGTDVITLTSGGAATFLTSPTTVQAGTAAAPSITFSGDTNTGIYSPGADTIAFTEGGVEAMRIDSAGRLGISTSSPSTWGTNLVVYGNQLTVTGAGYDGTFADSIYFGGNNEGTTYRNRIRNSLSSSASQQQMQLSVASGSSTFIDALTLNGLGNLALSGGTKTADGIGITFPATQSASSNANTLDDYEEGTWTPAIAFGGASVGVTYDARAGNYTKIGRVVHFWCQMNLTSKGSSTGNITITGLPFTASDTGQGWLRFSYNASLPSFPVVTIDGGGTALIVRGSPNNMDPLTNANIAGTAQIQFAGFYYA